MFATDVSEYAGQAVALAVADTQEHAHQMAQAVTLTYQSLGKQILTIQDAIAANSFYKKDPDVNIGDADGKMHLICMMHALYAQHICSLIVCMSYVGLMLAMFYEFML